MLKLEQKKPKWLVVLMKKFKSYYSIMNNKIEELFKWSNPKQAQKMAYKYLGKDADLYVSTRKNKKYMVETPDGKMIHFGTLDPPMEDYTKHKDKERRDRFRKRNAKWSQQDKWTAGWLSYYILW